MNFKNIVWFIKAIMIIIIMKTTIRILTNINIDKYTYLPRANES